MLRRRSSSGDMLQKRKRMIAVDKLTRGHGKSGERIGRVASRGGCCVRRNGRSWQWKMIGLMHGFGCLWAMMRKWEASFCVADGRCRTYVRRRIEKGKRAL